MTKIFIHENDTIAEFDTDNHVLFLVTHFGKWRKNNGVYANAISPSNRIPLSTMEEIRTFQFESYEVLHVVIYPEIGFIGVALLGLTVASIFIGGNKSKKETATRKVPTAGSPNNGLSARENTERIGGRISDIYGKVRCVPDLLTPPYIIYQNNQEVEYSLSVIGRGSYTVSDVKDGETLLSAISGAAVQVYAPGNYPTTAQLTVGSAISETIVAAKKSNNVNGQKLLAPNANSVHSAVRFKFFSSGLIEVNNATNPDEQPDIEFDSYFAVGNTVSLTGVTGSTGVFLYGNYVVSAVDAGTMTFSSPATVNANWSTIGGAGLVQTGATYFFTSSDRSVGPFIVEGASNWFCNFVAEEGLYKDDGTQQLGIAVIVRVTVQAVTIADVPTGTVFTKDITLRGSSQSRGRVAVTLRGDNNFTDKRFQISAKRLTDKDFTYIGQVSDEITYEGLFGVDSISTTNLSDLTVVKSATFAGPNSLGLKSRKLNMLVHRKLPILLSDGTFGADAATSNFADIMVAICKDAKIGNLTDSKIDKIGIYNASVAIASYFGTALATEFNYTFDDENLSFEEMLSMVAETVHCNVYRQGSVIKVFFEKENDSSRLLFNHRNKIPGSEKRTFNFGNLDDHDGVEVKYVDTKDGSELTYFIPLDQSAVNADVLDVAGLTNKLQAYFHANRMWNKIRYRNTSIQFEATQEANLLVRGERILIADNTRPETFDGEIIAKDGLLLTLSEDFEAEVGEDYSIFLQLIDATVESIPITPTTNLNQVTLDYEPAMGLAIGLDLYAACTYEIVKDASTRKRAFLLDTKTPQNNFVSEITAYNYDSRFYENDSDYSTSVVDINGNLI